MLNSSVLQRKLSTVILIGALLVPASSFAGSRKPAAAAPVPGNLFELFCSVLVGLWSESGCKIDPNGQCLAVSGDASSVGKADTGCSIDPNGRCLAKTPADTGCSIDPDGHCLGRR
jgi:hypothetical protein